MINIIKNPSYRVKILLGILVFFSLGLYSLFAARGIIQNPRITISEPENGSHITNPTVAITGSTNTLSSFTINGRVVPLHENNTFSNVIILKEGYNIIVLEAGDRFGRTTEKTLEIMHTRETLTNS